MPERTGSSRLPHWPYVIALSHDFYDTASPSTGDQVMLQFCSVQVIKFSLKDEKLIIDFCVSNCAVMGQILVNGTLLL